MITTREVKKILEKNGYRFDRANGSHGQFVKKDEQGVHRVTLVINHLSHPMAKHHVKKLEKETGLSFK